MLFRLNNLLGLAMMAAAGQQTQALRRGPGQSGCVNRGAAHPVDRNGQHRNPERAQHRRLTRALGGRRQALKTRKTMRRLQRDLQAQAQQQLQAIGGEQPAWVTA